MTEKDVIEKILGEVVGKNRAINAYDGIVMEDPARLSDAALW